MLSNIVIKFILIIFLYIIAHEGSHFIAAMSRKLSPSIRLEKKNIKGINIPFSFVVNYKVNNDMDNRIVSTMGFGGGLIVGLVLLFLSDIILAKLYFTILTLHFIWYPFKNKDSSFNDFNGMDSDTNPAS